MDFIAENIREVQKRIESACERSGRSPHEITLVAVTKTVDAATIKSAYEHGIKNFGENRVQEAEKKIEELAALRQSITWHMIGHVQTNKIKSVTRLFNIVQSVDSMKLATGLDMQTQETLPVLLQVNVSGESTKSGFSVDQVSMAISEMNRLPHLNIKGLMTIAPWTDNEAEIRSVFRTLRELRDKLGLEHLSMGMTDDYEIAIEEGSTIVRIGRAIFGKRRT
jgi:pyridoxal phosphate enzyme (YggS family)